MIGQSISSYQIIERLGEAGLGEIWLARDTKVGRLVSLKFLPPDMKAGGEDLRRAVEEARAVCDPSHPHICTVHDHGEHEGRPFLVMEVAEGEPLSRRLEAGPLDTESLVDLGIQIADAMRTAHARRICHGALDAGSVLLTEGDQVKVMDFGVGKLPRSAGEADPSGDIRSIGAILRAMATGASREGGPGRPAERHTPESLERIIERALGEGPGPPYGDLTGLVDDLSRVMSDQAPEYVPPPPPPEEPEPARRGVPWGLLLAVAVLAAGAAAVLRACG